MEEMKSKPWTNKGFATDLCSVKFKPIFHSMSWFSGCLFTTALPKRKHDMEPWRLWHHQYPNRREDFNAWIFYWLSASLFFFSLCHFNSACILCTYYNEVARSTGTSASHWTHLQKRIMDPLTPCWCTLCMCAMFSHGGYLPLERKITGTLSNFSNKIYIGIEFLVIDVCHWHHTVWNCFIATISFILEARPVCCLEGSSFSAVVMGRHLSYFSLILLLAHLYIFSSHMIFSVFRTSLFFPPALS